MLKNYFKISIRNLLRYKVYSGINILGLAFGLAAFFLISLYTSFEQSYDRFFEKSDQLYRLTTDLVNEGVIGTRDAMSFAPSGKALSEELPEVLDYTTTYMFQEIAFRHSGKVRSEEHVVGADSNYFKLFDYTMIHGNPLTALEDPYSIVLTESKARDYFGSINPVGKTLELLSGFGRNFKVTGVIEDVPENTHYKFEFLISLSSIKSRIERDAWRGFNYYTYLLLDENANIPEVQEKLPDLTEKYLAEGSSLVFNLQPVKRIHLYSNFTYEPEIHGNAKAVRFLSIIGLFVLIIAWVNYINLSTARAIDRAKEVGLRKVIGAKKGQLVTQFLFESLLINGAGILVAVGLAELFLPTFNILVGKELAKHVWESSGFLTNAVSFFLLGTFVTGLYPALVLSQFKPVIVLKGKFRNSKGGILLRKGLVVAQFAVSIVMIAGTFIVIEQVNYMRNKDKGFDIENVIGLSTPLAPEEEEEAQHERKLAFMQTLRDLTDVINVGATSDLPGGGSADISSSSGQIQIVGMTDPLRATTYIHMVDDQFFETMDMKILHGRNFNHELATDTSAIIVNQAFVRRFGIAELEKVVNERVRFGIDPENERFPIVGVLQDFNRTSLKIDIEPTVYVHQPEVRSVVVRLSATHFRDGIDEIATQWTNFFPNAPLDIRFLDERFEKLYAEDKRFGSVFGAFSGLAILVAILGLFGLSSFMAVQRTKEMGIRKVLGAPITRIVMIFYKDFAFLIGVAALIGMPTLYLIMNGWLDNYAYRIPFPWLSAALALVIILLFALITVGYQIYKVAVLNPAKIIRYE